MSYSPPIAQDTDPRPRPPGSVNEFDDCTDALLLMPKKYLPRGCVASSCRYRVRYIGDGDASFEHHDVGGQMSATLITRAELLDGKYDIWPRVKAFIERLHEDDAA